MDRSHDGLAGGHPDSKVLSHHVLHPVLDAALPLPSVFPLSILDNTSVRAPAAGGAWFYPSPTSPLSAESLSTPHLLNALQTTLDSYPEWAGQLQWIPPGCETNPTSVPARGFGLQKDRSALTLTGQKDKDPGISVVEVTHPLTLIDFIPNAEERADLYDATGIPHNEVTPQDQFPFHWDDHFLGRRCLAIQITRFSCGGTAISIKLCHALGDATGLTCFLKDWARVSRAMLSGRKWTPPARFNPERLNALAGNVYEAGPSTEVSRKLDSLPVRSLQYVADKAEAEKERPENIEDPTAHFIIHFNGEEVFAMWEAASRGGQQISKMDAVQAHIWGLVIRSLGFPGDKMHGWDMGFGFRQRLGLPQEQLGSCVRVISTEVAASRGGTDDISLRARLIRGAVDKMDGEACRAILNDMAYWPTTQESWSSLDHDTVTTTSWCRLGFKEVDFGAGAAVWVDVHMILVPGWLQFVEASPAPEHAGGEWYASGIDATMYLPRRLVESIVQDPGLRLYRK